MRDETGHWEFFCNDPIATFTNVAMTVLDGGEKERVLSFRQAETLLPNCQLQRRITLLKALTRQQRTGPVFGRIAGYGSLIF